MTGDNSTVKVDPEPELRRTQIEPRGVLQRNLKVLVYLGGAILVIVAAIFSSTGKKTQMTKGQPPQPMVQDNTDNNVQDLKNQLHADQQKGERQATVPNPDYAPGRSLLRVCARAGVHPGNDCNKIRRRSSSPQNSSKQSNLPQRTGN